MVFDFCQMNKGLKTELAVVLGLCCRYCEYFKIGGDLDFAIEKCASFAHVNQILIRVKQTGINALTERRRCK